MDNDPHLDGHRNRYSVRLARLAAGSALTAASVVSLTGFTTAGAAAPVTTIQPDCVAPGTAAVAHERINGVRAELDHAVSMGMVTDGQADHFVAQLEGRIARGL
ncbi:hypothetical protein [Arthrobacter roseus]|uniref:hypothetical protein n=1 Tax=Arthrobacter roseus TaxID=136274 RepID=UPI0019633908|nr:hypothetical protein [Arthrobacter roseus]MBM7849406.1 hypothetical protein [Arthrobacter roseus]